MKLDGTVTPTIADENNCFPKGKHVTWIDGQSDQGIKRTSSEDENISHKWAEDPTSWGYLFMHNKKVEKFEAEVNKDGRCRCFVHRSVFYEKARHGVKKMEKLSISGFFFLQGRKNH